MARRPSKSSYEHSMEIPKNEYVDKSLKFIVRAKGEEQKLLLETINKNVITFVDGPPGSGKTFLSAYFGISLLLNDKISNMIITRPAVESGEKFGYIPGEIENKFSIYLMPIFDALNQIISDEQMKILCKKNGEPSKIRTLPIAFMRGLSFRNSYVLLDEGQNTSSEQLRMVLTRIGENSKIVVVGDVRQSDIRNCNGLKDAMGRFSNIANKNCGIGIVTLTKKSIIRHPIIEIIEEAYENKDVGFSN